MRLVAACARWTGGTRYTRPAREHYSDKGAAIDSHAHLQGSTHSSPCRRLAGGLKVTHGGGGDGGRHHGTQHSACLMYLAHALRHGL